MKRRNVLIIEGDDELARVLAEALSSEGYRVAVAPNGRQGVELARRERPDLILLDTMRTADSSAFREVQSKEPELASIPLVVITSDGRARERAKRLSPRGQLSMPLSLERLLGEVERVISAGP